ncbi:hypothetical protein B0A58_15145 [Flavobacterium branchiophilum NBRC 15030 = ATCC 35035]|uniref:Uncharacterized protein n=1 Tax=Flavobacterium branchiophilum TaxID=55197 RepID=A0A543G296_9FLAO|nr:hypothetical protein [Flavobacterium branchiophilum]OXA69822.1 hypothetical protein B0A58_15145 [Flavobacterium branchiophilum NBRC 15030 = ATCC 35035]TQM40223.1 hypothetical protein BC670_1098 [Flavobacterium branchiophilum]GEM55843.1 hypothetical protein FB1_20640 [Flavobacterium branchiophilum NBRC 15030 = ATCC 35035]
MSKESYIGGDYIEWTGGKNEEYAKVIRISSNEQNNFTAKKEITYGKYQDPPEEEREKTDVEIVMYETDGHYSTVYLICLMLGVSEENALELAIAAENPDTDVHSETDFELDDTWSDAEYQESIHALTGGFHGVEEFFTAIKILYTSNSNITKIGELLHRLGDSYAHSKIDNIVPEDLDTYNLSEHPENEKKAIKSWKGIKGENLGEKITPWLTFFNYYMKKYPDFLTNKTTQKKALHGKDLNESLRDIYLLKPSDKYIMYGGEKIPVVGGTADHFSSDKGYPDLIYMRPDWYLTYVKNLSWILATKYKKNLNNFDIDTFKKMVKFATENKCTMKGIIDYEIAKKRNKKEVIIPVFYSNPDRFFASIDAVKNSDYYKTATEVVDNTKKYITLDSKNVVLVDKVKGSPKVNFSTGFFNTLAFKIKFE